MKRLRPKQAKFVQEVVKHGNAAAAARAAGYAKNSSTVAGSQLMKQPAVKEALNEIRNKVVEDGAYNLKMAMAECTEAMAFAKLTENANAYTKAVELRAKLNGLMVERHDMRTVGFHVSVTGIDFSKRNSDSLPPIPDMDDEGIFD